MARFAMLRFEIAEGMPDTDEEIEEQFCEVVAALRAPARWTFMVGEVENFD